LKKPGGKIIQNIISGGFSGELFAINPKYNNIQGIPSFRDINELPPTDLAILAIPAEYCKD